MFARSTGRSAGSGKGGAAIAAASPRRGIKRSLAGLAALVVVAPGGAWSAQVAADAPFTEESPADPRIVEVVPDVDRLYRMACLSVVRVRTVSALGESIGSGFLLGDGGESSPRVVVTAFTSEGEPEQVSVVLGDRELAARIAVVDPTSRIGLLDLGEPVEAPSLSLVDPGSDVAIGSPFLIVTEDENPVHRALEARLAGRERSIRHRPLPLTLWRMHFRVGDAAFGAPVLDGDGRVAAMVLIGIPQESGAAYAVPAGIVRKIYEDHAAGRTPRRGWLGVLLEEGTTTPRILECRAGGPAARAGLRAGDVILRIGERVVDDYWDVIEALFFLSPGRETDVEVLRGLEQMTLPIVPGEPPARGTAPPDAGSGAAESREGGATEPGLPIAE